MKYEKTADGVATKRRKNFRADVARRNRFPVNASRPEWRRTEVPEQPVVQRRVHTLSLPVSAVERKRLQVRTVRIGLQKGHERRILNRCRMP